MKEFVAQYKKQVPPLVSEENYEYEMKTMVEPALEACRLISRLDTLDGRYISYEEYYCEDAIAIIMVSHGFTESAEKFREMIWYFLQMGYKVFALDHCGHGHSYRYVEDWSISHIERFDDYVEDLHCLMRRIKQKYPQLPCYIYGHSMGGGVAARYIQKYPDDFSKAILTAPMIAADTGGYPVWMSELLTGLAVLLGKKRERIFLHKPFNPNQSFENSADTSRARFQYYLNKCVQNPHLQNSSASYNWVREALHLTKVLLNEKNCQRVKAKVLLFQAEKDEFVRLPEQETFVRLLPNAHLKKMPHTKHEIYASTNDVMEEYIRAIAAFLLL